MAGKANGEICEKHPQLDGLRYLPARTCVGCVKANSKRLYRERTVLMPQQIARLTAERDALQARLTAADERVDVLEGQIVSAYETAARWVEKRSDDYVNEHGSSDPETGSIELPGTGEEYVCELLDIAEGLRALKPAEGRGDPNCLLCLDKKTVPSNLAEGYVMDCPDCCVEEG